MSMLVLFFFLSSSLSLSLSLSHSPFLSFYCVIGDVAGNKAFAKWVKMLFQSHTSADGEQVTTYNNNNRRKRRRKNGQAQNLPVPLNRRSGFTIATKRSSDMATRVNTDTPVEKSFINSEITHTLLPKGHESTVYTTDTNGTAVNISMRSAIDNDKMCLNENRKHANSIYSNIETKLQTILNIKNNHDYDMHTSCFW